MMVQVRQGDGGRGSGGMGLVDTAGGGRGAGIGDVDVPIDIWGSQWETVLFLCIFFFSEIQFQPSAAKANGPL